MPGAKFKKITRSLAILLAVCLLFQQSGIAQEVSRLNLAGHLGFLKSQMAKDKFRPLHLRYLEYDLHGNKFRLFLDKGDAQHFDNSFIKDTSRLLLKYFLIGLSLPNDSFWVNLRPDSADEIIDVYLAQTDIGRIMLEADLQLKKDTAQATSPQTAEGKEYWSKVYQKAQELFGSENITIPTLTRPWIVPDEIIIRETEDSAYIYKATLKVMLEQDYLKDSSLYNFADSKLKILNEYSTQLIRELIIPKLTKRINSSRDYASLRQVYYSLILAQWFKAKFSGSDVPLSQKIDSLNIVGLTAKVPYSKETYFEEYKKSFAHGEYNIYQPAYSPSGKAIRRYFSGGINFITPLIPGSANHQEKVNLIVIPASNFPPLGSHVIELTMNAGEEGEVLPAMTSQTDPEQNLRKKAERVLAREITDEEFSAIKKAHEIGQGHFLGHENPDGTFEKNQDANFAYTFSEISQKTRILKAAGFNQDEIRSLMKHGIVGSRNPKDEASNQRKRPSTHGAKLVAQGDVHGEFDGLLENLIKAGLVDQRGEWIGNDAIFVQVGDVIDRGPKSREVFDYLRRLQKQAELYGGKVIRLLGNHELMIMQGIYRYANYSNPRELAENIRQDILNGKILACYVYGGRLFVHGGLRSAIREKIKDEIVASKGIMRNDITLQDISERINEILVEAVRKNDFSHVIFQADAMRGGVGKVAGIFWVDFSDLESSKGAGEIPQVVGHTLAVRRGKNFLYTQDGTRIDIDGGLFSGYGGNQVFLIMEGNRIRVVYKDESDWEEQEIVSGKAEAGKIENISVFTDIKLRGENCKIKLKKDVWVNAGYFTYRIWTEKDNIYFQRYDRPGGSPLGAKRNIPKNEKYGVGSKNNGQNNYIIKDPLLSESHFEIYVAQNSKGDLVLEIEDMYSLLGTTVEFEQDQSAEDITEKILSRELVLTVGDFVVSKSGTQRKVVAVEDGKIIFEVRKNGNTYEESRQLSEIFTAISQRICTVFRAVNTNDDNSGFASFSDMRGPGADSIIGSAVDKLEQAMSFMQQGRLAEAKDLLDEAINGDEENGVRGFRDIVDSFPSLKPEAERRLWQALELLKKIEKMQSLSGENQLEALQAKRAAGSISNTKLGGIDFRKLPIVTKAIGNLNSELKNMPLVSMESYDLQSQGQELENLINSGIIPSSQRIKDFLLSSCYKNHISEVKNQLMDYISKILRIEEEQSLATDTLLKDILIILEAIQSPEQAKDILGFAKS